jgi:hypothetical protein
MTPNKKTSPALAAFLILIGVGVLFYIMPIVMLWLAEYSVWLAASFGALAVLAFFAIFWLRARQQRSQS